MTSYNESPPSHTLSGRNSRKLLTFLGTHATTSSSNPAKGSGYSFCEGRQRCKHPRSPHLALRCYRGGLSNTGSLGLAIENGRVPRTELFSSMVIKCPSRLDSRGHTIHKILACSTTAPPISFLHVRTLIGSLGGGSQETFRGRFWHLKGT